MQDIIEKQQEAQFRRELLQHLAQIAKQVEELKQAVGAIASAIHTLTQRR